MILTGKTISELEQIYTNQPAMGDVILSELDVRKARRLAKGLDEKAQAKALRNMIQGNQQRRTERVNSGSQTASIAQNQEVYWISHLDDSGKYIEAFQAPLERVRQIQAQNKGCIYYHDGSWRKISELLPEDRHLVSFNPTTEQEEARQLFQNQEDMRIFAFAGAGKTSTLKLLSKSTTRGGIYFAFNRAIVNEAAGAFPTRVECKTIHSHAKRAIRTRFPSLSNQKLVGKVTPKLVIEHISIPELDCGAMKLLPEQVAGVALATIRRFAYSRHDDFSQISVPLFGVLANLERDDHAKQAFSLSVKELASRIWGNMIDARSALPLGHDGYLKLWALTHPRIATDYILLDEAQDTNEVVLEVLRSQQCQVVYVGDEHQQIYEWRGAVNALQQIETPLQCRLTKSFRFGQPIADLANIILRKLGERSRISGNEKCHSCLGPVPAPKAIIARTNAGVLATIVSQFDGGRRVYVEGGVKDLQRLIRGVYQLRDHGRSDVPEFFGFESWEDVVAYSETEFGQELATFVSLVQSIGLGRLWHLLKQVEPSAETAQVAVSTVHKAKGREWESVRLCDDFIVAETDDNGKPMSISHEDLRVIYVAITRACNALEIGPNLSSLIQIQ
jgi:hypothetical protein